MTRKVVTQFGVAEARNPALHIWRRAKPSEPMRCIKCGTYYADAKATFYCPANNEAA